jgi:hypothetical protein
MITLLSSDDESVGLLGHELGHILAHQNAVMVSQLFHEILGVNGVSDRQEVSEKFAELLGTIDRNKKMLRKAAQVMERQEAINQYEADRVALMLRLLVDFSPQAFRDLFERSSETNGRRGNLTTDFFAATTSNKRRLREINKTLKRLPKQCREIVPASSNEFRTWRAAVLSYADFAGQ